MKSSQGPGPEGMTAARVPATRDTDSGLRSQPTCTHMADTGPGGEPQGGGGGATGTVPSLPTGSLPKTRDRMMALRRETNAAAAIP